MKRHGFVGQIRTNIDMNTRSGHAQDPIGLRVLIHVHIIYNIRVGRYLVCQFTLERVEQQSVGISTRYDLFK